MPTGRQYTTRRQQIVNALVDKIKTIDGSHGFLTDLSGNVFPRLKFWDEVEEFPAVHLNAGSETRDYNPGRQNERYLTITIRCYVQEEDAVDALDRLLEDVETVIEENSRLQYFDKRGKQEYTLQMSILNIDTDEGVLEPLGVGEILLQVQY